MSTTSVLLPLTKRVTLTQRSLPTSSNARTRLTVTSQVTLTIVVTANNVLFGSICRSLNWASPWFVGFGHALKHPLRPRHECAHRTDTIDPRILRAQDACSAQDLRPPGLRTTAALTRGGHNVDQTDATRGGAAGSTLAVASNP